jgi:hypothetical protein
MPSGLLAVGLRGEGFQAIQDILGADISFYSERSSNFIASLRSRLFRVLGTPFTFAV